jgi:hypothetical protein
MLIFLSLLLHFALVALCVLLREEHAALMNVLDAIGAQLLPHHEKM